MHRILLPETVDHDRRSGENVGDQRWICNARRAHIQRKHADAVAGDVDNIRDDRNVHRHVCFPDTAAKRRSGVINGEERQRKCCDKEIGLAGRHDVRFNSAEKQPQKRCAEYYDHNRQHKGKQCGNHQKLPRRAGCVIFLLVPYVLADDNCTARCQRREQEDKNGVE